MTNSTGLYEIHITVINQTCNAFVDACKNLNIKPIVLDLQSRGDEIIPDLMSSSKVRGSFSDALVEATRLTESLQSVGMEVVRQKIETPPWQDAALSSERLPWQYFESHFQLPIGAERKDPLFVEKLKSFCIEHNLHLSRNALKEESNGVAIQMATLRDYNAAGDEFAATVNAIKSAFNAVLGIPPRKVDVEFAIYDTNNKHDASWMSQ